MLESSSWTSQPNPATPTDDASYPYYRPMPPAPPVIAAAPQANDVQPAAAEPVTQSEPPAAPAPVAPQAPVVSAAPQSPNLKSSNLQSPDPQSTPQPIRHPRLIALMNQKGGVGKTTSTVNLGAALAEQGQRVLLVDLDPQAHLSLHMGVDPANLASSVYDLLLDPQATAADVRQMIDEHLHLIPADVNLAGAETELAPRMATGLAQRLLKQKLAPLLARDGGYDFVLIDCPPSLGLLTISALVLAEEVFVPMQAHFLALQGLSKLLETVQLIQQGFNPLLQVTGILLCMHDHQTNLASEVVADVERFLEAGREQATPWRHAVLLQPPIRRNIKLAEAPSFGQTIFQYEPHCAGARDYERIAAAVLAQGRPRA